MARILPARYFWLIPSLYLFGLGAYDITTDIISGSGIWWRAAIDIVLCLPLLIRSGYAFIAGGGLAALIFNYLLLALTSDFVNHLNGTKVVHTANVYFCFGYPFLAFTAIMGILLAIIGAKTLQANKDAQNQ